MKVIFRSNDNFAKKVLGKLGGAEKWLHSLSKYISEDAILRLSLFVDKNKIAEAALDITDVGIHIHATETNENMAAAVDSVVHKSAIQLVKEKGKSVSRMPFANNESIMCDDMLNSELQIDDSFRFIEAEQKLADKKKTAKYNRVVARYIDYLYDIKDIENEIESTENQLAILYAVKEDEFDTILHRDYLLLTESIEQLNKKINDLINIKNSYKMNVRDEAYIEETIDEELNLLKLKREANIE